MCTHIYTYKGIRAHIIRNSLASIANLGTPIKGMRCANNGNPPACPRCNPLSSSGTLRSLPTTAAFVFQQACRRLKLTSCLATVSSLPTSPPALSTMAQFVWLMRIQGLELNVRNDTGLKLSFPETNVSFASFRVCQYVPLPKSMRFTCCRLPAICGRQPATSILQLLPR